MHTRTFLLMAALVALFGAVGYLIGGSGGMLIALAIAGAMNLMAYWNSDKVVLSMYRAQPVSRADSPEFYDMVAGLAQRAQIPMPKLYVIAEAQPNAFATGRNPENAAVAVTEGIMRVLTKDELAGVVAHELAHIKNRDTLMMTITATLAGAIGMLGNLMMFTGLGGSRDQNGNGNPLGLIGALAMMILAPLAATMVQMAISRTREYEADRVGAEICGNPRSLASALEKIEAYAQGTLNVTAEHNPATAHMFISNPLSGRGADNLFSTHPATRNRVARLMEMMRDGLARVSTPSGYNRPAARGSSNGPWG